MTLIRGDFTRNLKSPPRFPGIAGRPEGAVVFGRDPDLPAWVSWTGRFLVLLAWVFFFEPGWVFFFEPLSCGQARSRMSSVGLLRLLDRIPAPGWQRLPRVLLHPVGVMRIAETNKFER